MCMYINMEMYRKGTKWMFMKRDSGTRLEVLKKKGGVFLLL